MISALVLVNTDLGEASTVLENIKNVEEVEEAHAVWGIYDLMVKIKARSIESLKEIIKFRIQQMAGVSNTLTIMIVDGLLAP